MNQVADEKAFAEALGLDPAKIKMGSINIEFTRNGAVVTYQGLEVIAPDRMGLAFLAAAGRTVVESSDPEPDQEQETEK